MASLAIRRYRAGDESGVAKLWGIAFPNDPPWNAPALVIRRKLKMQPELFFVGELAGNIVATVLAGYDGVRGWIYHLAVAPNHRRKGFGLAMMRAAEERLRGLRATNKRAIRLYSKLRFVDEGRFKKPRALTRRQVCGRYRDGVVSGSIGCRGGCTHR